MGFAAVARVTEDRWVACSVLDEIDFGLKPGDELRVETTPSVTCPSVLFQRPSPSVWKSFPILVGAVPTIVKDMLRRQPVGLQPLPPDCMANSARHPEGTT
jgi:hypothetical protein